MIEGIAFGFLLVILVPVTALVVLKVYLVFSPNGIRIKFNPRNVYGDEECCCQKRYYTKFGFSTLYCLWCNVTTARPRLKVNSFCKKNGWNKTCRTCNQVGQYTVVEKHKSL